MSEPVPEPHLTPNNGDAPGITLARVTTRLYVDAEGDVAHGTYIDTAGGELPQLYTLLGAVEMAKDTIKEYYSTGYWPQDGEDDEE